MSCCCSKIFKVCQPVNTCEGSELHINYEANPGEYIFQIQYLGALINKNITVGVDGIVKIATEDLNESYTFTGKLLDLNGAVIPLTSETVEYDCVQFKTMLTYGSLINLTDAGNVGVFSYIFEATGDFEINLNEGQTLDYITFSGPSISIKVGTTDGGGELADTNTDGQPVLLMHQADTDKTIYVTGVPAGTIIKIKKS